MILLTLSAFFLALNNDSFNIYVNRILQSVRESKNEIVAEKTIGESVVVDSISSEKYCYSTLSDEGKVVYDQILNCILNMDEKVRVDTLDQDVLSASYEAVTYDYGGLFWVSGYKYTTYYSGDDILGFDVSPKYTMTEEERDAYQEQVDAVVEEWLSGISSDATDYEKSKYVYDLLIENVDYVTGVENNQNILSVFLNRQTVCMGYACAASYLLSELGIQSCIVQGQALGQSHAWNLVLLDSAYYFMDVTWGNSRFTNSDSSIGKHVNYAYLNATSEELSSNHTIEMDVELPECLSTYDNYFYQEGLYFEDFDEELIGQTIARARNNGEDNISMKFGNSDVYQSVMNYFITEGHITDYIFGLKSVTYLQYEEANVLTIFF